MKVQTIFLESSFEKSYRIFLEVIWYKSIAPVTHAKIHKKLINKIQELHVAKQMAN